MTRSQLEDVAYRELGFSLAQMREETVASLRERIRAQRKVTETALDPYAKKPVGLTKMKKEDLVLECQLRNIAFTGTETNLQMQVKIMDDVKTRQCMEQAYIIEATTDPWAMAEESPESKSSSSRKRQA